MIIIESDICEWWACAFISVTSVHSVFCIRSFLLQKFWGDNDLLSYVLPFGQFLWNNSWLSSYSYESLMRSNRSVSFCFCRRVLHNSQQHHSFVRLPLCHWLIHSRVLVGASVRDNERPVTGTAWMNVHMGRTCWGMSFVILNYSNNLHCYSFVWDQIFQILPQYITVQHSYIDIKGFILVWFLWIKKKRRIMII